MRDQADTTQFNPMRRNDRALPADQAEALLRVGEYGILCLNGLNGYPHAIPMSYALEGDVLWMHAATKGTKLSALRADARATFCVVGGTEVLPAEFATRYESVIAYGEILEVAGDDRCHGLLKLAEKYAPGLDAEAHGYVESHLPATTVLKLTIRHFTGKARR